MSPFEMIILSAMLIFVLSLDGQEVEFSVENEADGRKKANNVTGKLFLS